MLRALLVAMLRLSPDSNPYDDGDPSGGGPGNSNGNNMNDKDPDRNVLPIPVYYPPSHPDPNIDSEEHDLPPC